MGAPIQGKPELCPARLVHSVDPRDMDNIQTRTTTVDLQADEVRSPNAAEDSGYETGKRSLSEDLLARDSM